MTYDGHLQFLKLNFSIRQRNVIQIILQPHLLGVLQNETEGIVRKESIFVIQQIYQHRTETIIELELLLSSMAHTAINDLHWEVKTTALDFWQLVIDNQINCKHLPIRSKADLLNDISLLGIFGILLECLNEDSDVVCIKKAVEVVKKLLELLHERNISTDIGNGPKDKCKLPEISVKEIVPQHLANDATAEITNDAIIDSICESNDLNLLSKMILTDVDTKTVDKYYYKQFCNVKHDDFLAKISEIKLDKLIDNRSDWIHQNNSFNSLLDDMMYSLQISDVNNIECY